MKHRDRDGFSESAWRSLAVKSLRIGWPEGLRQAELRIGKSQVRHQLSCGLWEDVFPPQRELADALHEIHALQYERLCERQTHHGRTIAGRRMSDWFCDLGPAAIEVAKTPELQETLAQKARELGLPYVPPRILNCLWTWLQIAPHDVGIRRPLDETPWTGMPTAVLDAHCYEGRRRRVGDTVASGSYEQHRALGQRVAAEGWEPVRVEFHAVVEPEPDRDEQQTIWSQP
jgi:hypothetical protein